jgi:hypothetical protein
MKVFLMVLVLAGVWLAPAAGAPDVRIEPLTLAFNAAATTPIYVEIDWMEDGTHSHRPSQAVIDRIVQTFARAGFTIHIDVSNAVPHQQAVDVKGSPGSSPEVQAIMAQHFDHSGDSRYHYSLWAHNFSLNGNFTTSSGIADLPGRVHLVTLGSFTGQVGTFSNQVGLFIHELGHNLNQRHGGADNAHYKPNYLSVMNYHYTLEGIGPVLLARGFANTASGFDDFSYSHGLMPVLDEPSLDEGFGAGLGLQRHDRDRRRQGHPGLGPLRRLGRPVDAVGLRQLDQPRATHPDPGRRPEAGGLQPCDLPDLGGAPTHAPAGRAAAPARAAAAAGDFRRHRGRYERALLCHP